MRMYTRGAIILQHCSLIRQQSAVKIAKPVHARKRELIPQ